MDQLSYNKKMNIYNGVAFAVAMNLVNPYFAIFASRLGATEYHMAFLNSWPAFISIFALIPGALLIDNLGKKQETVGKMMMIHKFFYLALATVPFISRVSQPWLFVVLIGFMNFPGSIYVMGYQSTVGDIFTAEQRAGVMSLRNRYSDLFRLVITLISGQLLARLPQNDEQTIILYQVFFFIAFFIGLAEVYTYKKFRLPAQFQKHSTGVNRKSILKNLKESFHYVKTNTLFKRFFICSLIFHMGWQMGWPLYNIYMIDTLGANESWLSAISIASGLSAILTATLWGNFADRYGNTLTIIIATFGMSITPFLYVLSESLLMLVFFNIIIGVSITGTVLVLFNMLLDVTPHNNRTTIIAIYNTLIAVSATIAPIIGVFIQNATSIQTALIIVGCFRLLGTASFYIRKKYAMN